MENWRNMEQMRLRLAHIKDQEAREKNQLKEREAEKEEANKRLEIHRAACDAKTELKVKAIREKMVTYHYSEPKVKGSERWTARDFQWSAKGLFVGTLLASSFSLFYASHEVMQRNWNVSEDWPMIAVYYGVLPTVCAVTGYLMSRAAK